MIYLTIKFIIMKNRKINIKINLEFNILEVLNN